MVIYGIMVFQKSGKIMWTRGTHNNIVYDFMVLVVNVLGYPL